MNTSQGALYFGAGIDMNQWRRDITEMRRDILGLTNETKRETQRMDDAFKKLSLGIGTYFSVNALQGFTQQLIQVRGEFQKTEIAFATMLKSKEKAKELMGQMVDLAAKTPFGLQEVSDGAKRLLAFQIPANEVVETLRRMGDVAAGLGVPMGQLIHVYGQVKAQGKLMTNDLYQFMNAGIPILAELGRVLGKSEAEVKKMVGEGKIGFTEIQQVIQNMTNEGGLFFNLMEQQSASLSGKVSNLQDAFEQMLNKIGESQEGILADGIDGVTYLVENYEQILDILKVLVATYGAYRAAIIATSVVENIRGRMLVQQALAQGTLSTAQAFGAVVTMNLQRATALLNTTMLANPFVLTATAIVGLVAALWGLDTATGSIQDRMQKWTNETKEVKNEAEGLINVVKSETATYLEKVNALEKLQSIAPETFANLSQEQVKAMDLTETYRLLNEELGRQEEVKKKMTLGQMRKELESLQKLKSLNVDDAEGTISKRIDELKRGIAELEFSDKKRAEALMAQNEPLEKQLEYWNEEERKINETIDAIKRKYPELDITKAKTGQLAPEMAKMQTAIDGLSFGSLLERLKQVQGYTRSIRNELNGAKDKAPEKAMEDMNKNEVEAKIKSLQEEKALLSKKEDIAKKQVEIDRYRRLSKKWDDTQFSTPKKQTKSNINKPIKGSLGALEKELSELNNRINDKTLISDEKTRNILLQKRKDLEKQIAEIKKKYNKKSFDEELTELERQWRVRYLLAEKYGEEIAKKQFPNLKGESYRDDIQAKFNVLDDKAKNGVSLSDEEVSQWERLKSILDNLAGVKDPFTNFKEDLDDSLSAMDNFVDKVAYLEGKMSALTNEQKSSGYEAEVRGRLENVQREYQKFYDEFLKNQRTFEERQKAISDEYKALRLKAKEDLDKGKISEDRFVEISIKIDKQEAEKQTDLFLEELQKSDKWNDAFDNIERLTTERLRKLRELLVQQLDKAKSEAEHRKIIVHIERVDKALNPRKGFGEQFRDLKGKFKEYADTKKKVKVAQEEYNEAVENFGKASAQAQEAEKRLNQYQQESFNKRQELANGIAYFAQQTQKYTSEIQGIVGDIKGAFEDLGVSLDNSFGDALEKIEGVLGGMNQVADGAMKFAQGFATGNPIQMIGGAVKAIGGIIKTVGSLFNNDRKKERRIRKEAEAVNQLKSAYEDLARTSQKAFGDKKYSSQTDLIKNLEQQKVHLNNMIREEDAKKKTDHGKIANWRNELKAIDRTIEDIKDNVIKDVLQTDVVDASAKMGDALVEAFGRGEDAAKSLEATANDLIKNLLKNQLNLIIQGKMKPILDRLFKETGLNEDGTGKFKGLSREQIERFKGEVKNAGLQMSSFLEGYKEIFNGLDVQGDSLKGAIRGMSEDTAGLLAGQFNAIRINTGEILKNQTFNLDLMKQSISTLIGIEQNTANLYQIKRDISELTSKVSGSIGSLKAKGII